MQANENKNLVIEVDGVKYEQNSLPIFGDGKEHVVEITLGE